MAQLWLEAGSSHNTAVMGQHERADFARTGVTFWAVDFESTHGTTDSEELAWRR